METRPYGGFVMSEMTPMMRQYLQIKEKNTDNILFFRLGDFYEMFFDDAKIASKELELTLTGKDCGMDERAPMCGIPYHSCEGYISRLVSRGYKVAICEQTEDPATAKGIVKREIVRIITPGTVIEGSMLDEAKNNYLASVFVSDTATGLCFCDISTGEVHCTGVNTNEPTAKIINEIGRFVPSEIILNTKASTISKVTSFINDKLNCTVNIWEDRQYNTPLQEVLSQFKVDTLEQIGLHDKTEILLALQGLIEYLKQTQMTGLERLDSIQIYGDSQYMKLDLFTRRNLELCETMRSKEKRGSLLWVIDKTKTAMGKRLIRTWLEQPLLGCAAISRRQNAVQELVQGTLLRSKLFDSLDGIFDLERLMTRIVYGTANGKELRSLAQTIERLPEIKESFKDTNSQLLNEINNQIDPLEDIFTLIDTSIAPEPSVSVKDGGIIKKGYNSEVDELHGLMQDGRGFLTSIEAQEREKTGIKTLKIGYNRVFGYYIEITNSNIAQVPDSYIRKQTLTNCERYITQELKELEGKVLGAQERAVQLEYELFDNIRKSVAEQLNRVQSTAKALAQIDVLCSFAETAVKNKYCCPQMSLDGKIIIKDGRHPVVEDILVSVPFVPNDTELDISDNRTVIITGPNMAGKSTYMRQVALITLMAQTGSFVPALSAKIGIVDSIFTRVGASDDLASGQSTFMVEMSEVANILKNVTGQSLLILDEIGRGTSTFDGMSIARAVVEYVTDKKKLGAKTLFATHYHELTELEDLIDGVKNYNIAVKKHGDEITFLRRIIRGGADDSYGIEVAKLAGIPMQVVNRAKEILQQLEAGQPVETRRKNIKMQQPELAQLAMSDPKADSIIGKLRSIDANTLSPIEAMNILFELWKMAKDD
jgi:DNA mismatch repair protein MutS